MGRTPHGIDLSVASSAEGRQAIDAIYAFYAGGSERHGLALYFTSETGTKDGLTLRQTQVGLVIIAVMLGVAGATAFLLVRYVVWTPEPDPANLQRRIEETVKRGASLEEIKAFLADEGSALGIEDRDYALSKAGESSELRNMGLDPETAVYMVFTRGTRTRVYIVFVLDQDLRLDRLLTLKEALFAAPQPQRPSLAAYHSPEPLQFDRDGATAHLRGSRRYDADGPARRRGDAAAPDRALGQPVEHLLRGA